MLVSPSIFAAVKAIIPSAKPLATPGSRQPRPCAAAGCLYVASQQDIDGGGAGGMAGMLGVVKAGATLLLPEFAPFPYPSNGGKPSAQVRKHSSAVERCGTLICCGALWTPRCHLPCHVTVL